MRRSSRAALTPRHGSTSRMPADVEGSVRELVEQAYRITESNYFRRFIAPRWPSSISRTRFPTRTTGAGRGAAGDEAPGPHAGDP